MEENSTQVRCETVENHAEEHPELFPAVGEQATTLDNGDDELNRSKIVDEIESLCMNCEQDGTTRLLLTKIPYFREIILMSFFCDHCNFKNTEVQSAGQIQEQGAQYKLKLDYLPDLQRQVVKSDTAVFRIEDLDLEVPAGRGRLTNVEGVLSEILSDLEKDQTQRKEETLELYEKIEKVVEKLRKMISGEAFPYIISINDPTGNSWIEPSPLDVGISGKYVRTEYQRSIAQNAALGLTDATGPLDTDTLQLQPTGDIVDGANESIGHQSLSEMEILSGQVYTLPCQCPGCTRPAHMNMQMMNIPYFKQVIISAVVCTSCGYRTSEVKTGGEVPKQGKRIWLQVQKSEDLSRDILKSETCLLKVPECKIEVQPGTMGGRFTTVEGILTQMRDDLRKSIFDIDDTERSGGDAMADESKSAWIAFFAQMDRAIRAEIPYTIMLEDPLANSYVQSYTAPEPDPQIREEDYERTEEEEEELGLSDMRTHLNEDGDYVKDEAQEKTAETRDWKGHVKEGAAEG